jgi:hypothetical protein
MNKHKPKCCKQCGCSDVPPYITWSNGRQTHCFCDNRCLVEWIEAGEARVLAEDVGPDFVGEMHRRAAADN